MANVNDIVRQYGILRDKVTFVPESRLLKSLKEFQDRKIEDMQKNLADSGRISSQRLSSSIVPEDIEVDDQGTITVRWVGEDYGIYVDQGVNGIKRNYGSAFSFRRPPRRASSPPNAFYHSIREWMKFKNISSVKYKDKKGRLKVKVLSSEEDYRQGAFVLIKTIQKYGIKPSHFIENAFDNENKVISEFEADLKNEWKNY